MLAIFGLIGVVIVIIFLCKLLYNGYCYEDSLPNDINAVKITFEDFYNWYSLNPSRWSLGKGYAKIKVDEYKIGKFYSRDLYETCYFNFKDWKKYRKFMGELELHNIAKKNNASTIKILEAVQQDIDALRKQFNQEIKEASNRAAEIAEKLKEQ